MSKKKFVGAHPECICGKRFATMGDMISHWDICEVEPPERPEGKDK